MGLEAQVQESILDWLRWNKIFHFRNNTGAFKSSYTNKRGETKDYYTKFGTPGSPDIICVIEGVFVGIECKSPKKGLSPDQRLFRDALKEHRGVYLIAKSLDDVMVPIKTIKETLKKNPKSIIEL